MAKTITDRSGITPDRRNANLGTQRGRRVVEDSLRQNGAGRSILVDRDGNVIAGNKTLEAAEDLDIPVRVVQTDGNELVVVQRTDLVLDGDDGRARQLAWADNRAGELGLAWDPVVLAEDIDAGIDLAGLFTEAEVAELLAGIEDDDALGTGDAEPQVDRAAELAEQWGTKAGQVWALGDHRLAVGDCTDAGVVEAVLGGERVDLVWTDPPYGVAIGDKNKHLNSIGRSNRVERNLTNDTLDDAGLLALLRAAFGAAAGACKPGASWYIAAPAGPLYLVFGQALSELGIWRQSIVWAKNNATFSPMGNSYHWAHEPIFYGWLPNGAHRYYGDRKQTTVWEIDRPLASPEHPTMKPVELVARAIQHATRKGEGVLDSFVGSGTTIIAAEQLGRRCYAVEIDPGYAAVTIQRWVDTTGGEPRIVVGAPS